MTVRANTSIKKQLTDATLINQDDKIFLDTADSESVTRNKTVRSLRHAVRRLIADADDKDLYVRTLGGAQVDAMKDVAAGTPTATQQYVNATSGVVSAATSSFTDFAPTSGIPNASFNQMINDVTVLYADGKFYIDDVGTTGLFRPKNAPSIKQSIRRVVSETATTGVYKLNTISGLLMSQIADLTPTVGMNISGVTAIFTAFDAATTTSATTQVALSAPSASTMQLMGSVLRQTTSGENRNVIVDDVGDEVTATTKGRISKMKLMRDLAVTDGSAVRTFSGRATSGISGLVLPSVEELVTRVQAAVVI